MPDIPIIEVDKLGKNYRLGSIGIGSLIDDLKRLSKKMGLRSQTLDSSKTFTALNKISFKVHRGEAFGIIGHNGAGKSTLLKILSRITEPSTGKAILRGRVASLLEVGTGFHPDMTGRENIFLNGALYGLTSAEIKDSFDSIVKFAHVEKFIDTPVKRYSSGMFVRLAFAVAAHLKPDILIVDEVLAVGDMGFQKKCMEKMKNITNGGMTILFVSHNMQMIRRLCSRSMLLEKGKVLKIGETGEVISAYMTRNQEMGNNLEMELASDRRRGTGLARFSKISYCDKNGKPQKKFLTNESVCFEFELIAKEDLDNLKVIIEIKTENEQEKIIVADHEVSSSEISGGTRVSFKISFDRHNLMPGNYPIYFWAGTTDHFHFDVIDNLLPPLEIIPPTGDVENSACLAQSESTISLSN